MKNIQRSLVLGASLVALAGCGADEIVSPGTSGDIIINNPSPTPTPTPTPTGGTTVTPAAGCPTILTPGGLVDAGTISGPTGEYRVCQLPSVFTTDDTLPAIQGLVYEISDEVSVGVDEGFEGGAGDIGEGVSLTIEPGAILYGQAASFLVVPRGNQLFSDGTETNPIIWTSRDNILGIATDASQAQWGGVVLLGRGRVSDCFDQTFNTTPGSFTNDCQMELEGNANTILFGGEFDEDSSGSFTFNQIRYSGFELLQGSELQSLTTGGVGSGTTISHIQSFNSSDDGLEFFGGTFNANNIAVVGASDDSLDVDSGARVNVETVVVVQRTNTGDSIIELDSPGNEQPTPANALPQSNFQVNNATFVQRSSASSQAVRGRGGAFLSLTNTVIDVDSAGDVCLRLDEDDNVTNTTVDSTVCDGDTRPFRGPTDAAVEALVNAGTNNDFRFALSLTGVVNGANENGVTPFDATARSSFFSNSTFVGAVESDLTADFGDWTCNSSILDFGSANGACTSLPTP